LHQRLSLQRSKSKCSRDLTAGFAKEVLEFKELSTKNIWKSVKEDPVLVKYFPDFNGETYVFATFYDFWRETLPFECSEHIETLFCDCGCKETKGLETIIGDQWNPIIVNSEYSDLLDNFETIA